MSYKFSKSKFIGCYTHCNKYAWLDKYKKEEKAPVDEFTQSIFDNGHKVGELAKQFFNVDVDVTTIDEDGLLNLTSMIEKTKEHLSLNVTTIAEASFSFGGFFCSVDILTKNNDGSYNIYEVKSSKKSDKEKKYNGVKEKYVIDAAYQQYVLKNSGIRVNKVYVVLLSNDYVRGKELELGKYFALCDVTDYTDKLQDEVKNKLAEIEVVLCSESEPATVLCEKCKYDSKFCDYFAYCSKNLTAPSPFDVCNLNFKTKLELYNNGVSFFDIPEYCKNHKKKISDKIKIQIEYYNKPNDTYVDKDKIKEFLDKLSYPLYSLDFETYLAVVPEFEGLTALEQVPFQYSLHILKTADGDYSEGSKDIEERSFLDISGNDTRRAIAESLVKDIPFGAQVIACHESTESGIIEKLANLYPDLEEHLKSFHYQDPQVLFKKGYCYNCAMGNSSSLKSILPALYPDDPSMNYKNLEGNIHNGIDAMLAIEKAKTATLEEKAKIEEDLKKYCALDTFAVVKIIQKLYELVK